MRQRLHSVAAVCPLPLFKLTVAIGLWAQGMQRGLFVCVWLCNGSKLLLLRNLHSIFPTNLAPTPQACQAHMSVPVSDTMPARAEEHVCSSKVADARVDKGKRLRSAGPGGRLLRTGRARQIWTQDKDPAHESRSGRIMSFRLTDRKSVV